MRKILYKKATSKNILELRSLAHQSEAYWGYSNQFMSVFDETFNITEEFIRSNPVYVLWDGNKVVAFWGLRTDNIWELEYFYVKESELGKGYGKILWNHMIKWCEEHDIHKIHFVTSHQAIGFYNKMGATLDSMAQSVIDKRDIPHFIYEIVSI